MRLIQTEEHLDQIEAALAERVRNNPKDLFSQRLYGDLLFGRKDLEGANKLILTCCAGNQEGAFGTTYDFLKAFSNISADEDKSGDVSIGEAAEYAKIIGTFESQTSPQTPQLSDVSNIGPTSYLIESKVEEVPKYFTNTDNKL